MKLACIVEGHGEVGAVPVLVRRILTQRALHEHPLELVRPVHRVPRGKLVKREELTRAVTLQAAKVGPGGAVLVLLDADDDCAATLGPQLQAWARRDDVRVGVVVAVRMFEAWLLASASSLAGVRGLPSPLHAPADAEAVASPKRWLDERVEGKYSETVDQPAFTARLDLVAASTAPSFRKLLRELSRLLAVDLCA